MNSVLLLVNNIIMRISFMSFPLSFLSEWAGQEEVHRDREDGFREVLQLSNIVIINAFFVSELSDWLGSIWLLSGFLCGRKTLGFLSLLCAGGEDEERKSSYSVFT